MKKTIIILIMLPVFAFSCKIKTNTNNSITINKTSDFRSYKSVVHFFNHFAKSNSELSSYYIKNKKIYYSENNEVVKDSYFPSVVDVKNGYISFRDSGTGGGSADYQFVLFRTAKKEPIIAISKKSFDGVRFTHESFVWELSNNKWKNVTASKMPKFNYKNFFQMNSENVNYFSDKYSYVVKFPQKGTKSTVQLDLPSSIDGKFCSDPTSDEAICKKRKSVLKSAKKRILLWDKKQAVFKFE